MKVENYIKKTHFLFCITLNLHYLYAKHEDRRRFGNSKKSELFFGITLNLHYLCHSINVFGYGDSFKEIAGWHTRF